MFWNQTTLTGWGRSCSAEVAACRPERSSEAVRAMAMPHPRGLIAHGAGRSYGDVALNSHGQVLLTRRLNRFLAFDPATGVLVSECGVNFADILATFLPQGFLFPVTPGTAFTTLGGGIANDVHGKNHDRVGSLGNHILWFDLLLPSGELRQVSPESDPQLFAATIGGLGLTGVILRAALRLVPVATNHMKVREERIGSIHEFIEALERARQTSTFSVGWIDALATGISMGRGILETAEFSELSAPIVLGQGVRRVPMDLPSVLLNPSTISLFNQMYYHRIPRQGRTRLVPLPNFFYPLDALLEWNRIYGKPGFYQFQCVVPNDEARRALPKLLEQISRVRSASFLAVIKTMGEAGRGLIGFPQRGFTLALDFPRRPGVESLITQLEKIVLDHGGRVYLAKDALLSKQGFLQMTPNLQAFQEVLDRVDPQQRLQSDLSRRLNIRGRG